MTNIILTPKLRPLELAHTEISPTAIQTQTPIPTLILILNHNKTHIVEEDAREEILKLFTQQSAMVAKKELEELEESALSAQTTTSVMLASTRKLTPNMNFKSLTTDL